MQTSCKQTKRSKKKKKKKERKKERKGTTIAFRAWNAQTMIESQNVDVLNQE